MGEGQNTHLLAGWRVRSTSCKRSHPERSWRNEPFNSNPEEGGVSSPRCVGSRAGKMCKFLPVLFLQKAFSRLTHPEVVHGGYCLLKFLGNLHGDILEKAGLNWAKGRQRGPIVLSSCKAKRQGDLRNEQRPKKMSPPYLHPQVLSSISSSGSKKIRRGQY